MCPELPDPSNGTVEVSGLTVGSTASYTCDDGFKLSENMLRMCETGGVWSGSEPLCESGTYSISCVYIDGIIAIGALWKCIIITRFLVSHMYNASMSHILVSHCVYIISSAIQVGYDPTTYFTSEGEGMVELNIFVFSHPVTGTPRPFTLSVNTMDGTASMPKMI